MEARSQYVRAGPAARLALLLMMLAGSAAAQPGSGATLTLGVVPAGLEGDWLVPLSQIDPAWQPDASGRNSRASTTHRRERIESALRSHLAVVVNGAPRPVRFGSMVLGTRAQHWWVKAEIAIQATPPVESVRISLDSRMAASEPHLVHMHWPGARAQSATLVSGAGAVVFQRQAAAANGYAEPILAGARHVWFGFDHVLFLLVLLLPALFAPDAWARHPGRRMLLLISVFTAFHTLALGLARGLQFAPEPRLMEAAIALSIMGAAIHNLRTNGARHDALWLALGVGLVHGLGAAGSASGVGDDLLANTPIAQDGSASWASTDLLGHGIGVWLGQIVIATALLPAAYLLRHSAAVRHAAYYGGSLLACAVSGFWIWQSGLDRGLLR